MRIVLVSFHMTQICSMVHRRVMMIIFQILQIPQQRITISVVIWQQLQLIKLLLQQRIIRQTHMTVWILGQKRQISWRMAVQQKVETRSSMQQMQQLLWQLITNMYLRPLSQKKTWIATSRVLFSPYRAHIQVLQIMEQEVLIIRSLVVSSHLFQTVT